MEVISFVLSFIVAISTAITIFYIYKLSNYNKNLTVFSVMYVVFLAMCIRFKVLYL